MGASPPMDIRNLLTSLIKFFLLNPIAFITVTLDMDFPVTFLTSAAANELLLSSEHCYGLVGITFYTQL